MTVDNRSRCAFLKFYRGGEVGLVDVDLIWRWAAVDECQFSAEHGNDLMVGKCSWLEYGWVVGELGCKLLKVFLAGKTESFNFVDETDA